MIKYKTDYLYGSLFHRDIINLNCYLLSKTTNINSEAKFRFILIFSYLIYYIELCCIIIPFRPELSFYENLCLVGSIVAMLAVLIETSYFFDEKKFIQSSIFITQCVITYSLKYNLPYDNLVIQLKNSKGLDFLEDNYDFLHNNQDKEYVLEIINDFIKSNKDKI